MILHRVGAVLGGLVSLCLASGCDDSNSGTGGTSGNAGSTSSDTTTHTTTASESAVSTSTGGEAPGWQAVTDAMEAASAEAGVADMGLVIFDAQDQRVYEHVLGAFTSDTRVAVASASKMVSGMVVFDVIREGLLSLDATTGQVLGWTGPHAAITVRHLLSFTSGLASNDPCTFSPQLTLEACVDAIEQKTPDAAPGTRFDYGSVHLAVAGRMAEVVTGKPWNQLFAERLQVPLGLSADVTYFTSPRAMVGTTNPLIAGGLRTSMNEYAPLLALVFHQGSAAGITVGTPALFAQQRIEPYPDVVIAGSPSHDFRYGLTAWLECDTPATGCDVLSSPGAFGWTPWLDRANGYYAILGMEVDDGEEEEDAKHFNRDLQQALKPLIIAAMSSG